jgi:5-deoxy-glucuronate isomerase
VTDDERWVRPFGAAAADGWDVVVDDRIDGWAHTALHVTTVDEGARRTLAPDAWERLVVPLEGSLAVAVVDAEGSSASCTLAGRPSVFAGPTDVAYVSRDASLTVTAVGGDARVAVCGARAARPLTPALYHLPVGDVPVELRGAGTASREVRNFGVPGVLDADALIACEVVTPGGNWSSYPPHKHDEHRPGQESELEEVYYFEVAPEAGSPASAGADPVGYQRVYGTDDRPIDVLAEVRTGDVVLVPHGWHGPAMAVPGYDLYYLNVMAGPGPERAWLICDDPAHGWVRETWATQPTDPRLPLGGTR